MSTPSFIDRLRSRSRRPDQAALLASAPPPLLETSPGPLPEDHWHAGDPRLAAGGTVLLAAELPSPRRPVDRRGLTVVPEVDLRTGVVDLRGGPAGPVRSAVEVPSAAADSATDTSTWLG